MHVGHNTNGEYIGKANKISYMCEKVPKPIVMYIEKTKDNHSIPVEVTDILDVACGTNHTVRVFFSCWFSFIVHFLLISTTIYTFLISDSLMLLDDIHVQTV